MTKIENSTKNFDHKPNKRKLAKELNADKSTASASIGNALDDGDTKDDLVIDRPKKKGGRKRLKNKQKKSQQKSDGFFCGAPSEYRNNTSKIYQTLLVNSLMSSKRTLYHFLYVFEYQCAL